MPLPFRIPPLNKSPNAFRWVPRGDDPQDFAPDIPAGYPEILRRLAASRGFTAASDLQTFLQPKLRDLSDPFLLPEMDLAVTRILTAIDRREIVCIFGDYDVDGISSIALLHKILSAYGVDAHPFIPNRGSEGYGLGFTAITRCLASSPRPDLLIAVDCGTCSFDEVAHLRSLGIDVIIADHHEPSGTLRPDCTALVNPKCGPSLHYLCAAGVVFKIGHALLKTRPAPLDLRDLLDLVAVATVADVVPLVGENRILVRHGLHRLPTTPNPGLKALQEITGIKNRVSSSDVGFRIGPRINAAGRMDAPGDALLILTTPCHRTAASYARKLDTYNKRRQVHESLIRKEARTLLDTGFDPENDPVIVLGSRAWHHGVVGIVASRLMRAYHKPAFVISINSDGVGKGSGRGIEGLSLVSAIRACTSHLISGGGHDMAAGLSIREENITPFRAAFARYVLENTTPEDRQPRLPYDAEITLAELSLSFLAACELLQPFGNGNPQPVFVSRRVFPERPAVVMQNNHLRLHLMQDHASHAAVFFGGGEHPLPDPPWDIAFIVDRNTFRGHTSLQIIIQDIVSSTQSTPGTPTAPS